MTLNADGSGSIQLLYSVSEEHANQLQELADSEGEEPGGEGESGMSLDFNDDDIRRDFEEFEPFGVSLKSVKTETVDGRKQRTLQIDFANLDGLARSGFLSDRNISISKNADGNYVFAQAGSDADEVLSEAAMNDPATLKLMEGFRAVVCMRMPGRILSTNAPEHDGQSATWTFDLAKDPAALAKIQAVRMNIVFDGEGLDLPEFNSSGGMTP